MATQLHGPALRRDGGERSGGSAGIEYDDPFDVMGYQRLWGTGNWKHPLTGSFRLKGTQAFNRYAAGWLPASAVTMHDSSVARYRLAPIGGEGTQLVVVPSQSRMAFLTLEAKVRRGYDRTLPRAGVQVHAIDQRGTACQGPFRTRRRRPARTRRGAARPRFRTAPTASRA